MKVILSPTDGAANLKKLQAAIDSGAKSIVIQKGPVWPVDGVLKFKTKGIVIRGE